MPHPHAPRRLPLALDRLEPRELPAASPWLVEPFQRDTADGLPAGWDQWASDQSRAFQVAPTTGGLGDQGLLVSSSASFTDSRAWLSAPFAADVETSAAVYLNSPAPVHLFVRGAGLDTDAPSYYAVAITRGAEVQLLKVVNGQATVLGSARSDEYLTNKWVTVSVRAEDDQLRVTLHRGDTSQFLTPDGGWSRRPTAAVEVTDDSIGDGGQVGFARPALAAGNIALDSLRVGAPKPTSEPIAEERFDRGPGLPAGWSQWSTPSPASFRSTGDETLRVDAGSDSTARAWVNAPTGPDVQVSSSIYVDSLVQAGVFARGSNLGTDRPTYYSATVTRGLEVKLWKVVGGAATTLGTVRSQDWISGQWVQASLVLDGDRQRVQVYRSDTGQYLMPDGTWALAPTFALTAADTAIPRGGRAGLSRGSGYAGQLVFDNFVVTSTPGRGAAPIPTGGDKPSNPTPPPDDLPGTDTPPPVVTPAEPSAPVPTNPGLPAVGRHYDWIRLANLAYYGTPLTGFEKDLLTNSIDLVIPNLAYLDDIAAVNPDTPQFIYTNVSNIYLNLLTDWTAYADRNGLDREAAFYHVNRATGYDGMSASAVPVNHFWGAYRGAGDDWQNVTRDAKVNDTPLGFADSGESLALGFVEKFREVNVDLLSPAAGGWAAELEYVAAVDDQGRPTEWKPLDTLGDTTGGLRRDGRLTFDPPRDWVAASVGGSARLFTVRFRTTADGIAPIAKSILGRDYTADGMIPAFDYTADRDRDGYLSDDEWAARADGFDARFEYEGRLFYPNYGPMRFAANVSDPGFRAWASDYHARFAAARPLVSGFFVDNSIGRLAVDTSGLRESLTGYSADYGSLLGAINRRLAVDGRWLIANTVGGNSTAEPIVRNGVSYLEEFALRPLAANHVQFDDLAATLRFRRQISGGKAYEILDTLPANGDADDPRVQLASLAMYYAVADPDLSFLMVNGGNEPASSWRRHWIGAAEFDVGRPLGRHTVVAEGQDPADRSLAYKVYGREYENALVLYKPLSYTRGETGGIGSATATTHRLDGWYRVVNADGTLGERVNQVSLRNGEGVILAKTA
ncbi:MAG TPA: hypothetical protein VFG68_19570 [Fimbriiglobus sp.]|nr:hypothetical protein [Fimbriiglobus sp.]